MEAIVLKTVVRVAAPIVIGMALLGVVSRSTPAQNGQEAPRASGICLDCHGGMDSTLAHTPHAIGKDEAASRVTCTDCHFGDRRHWEEDPEKYPMTNPATLSARAEGQLCARCHQTSHQQNMAERNTHMTSDVSCSACHGVHQSASIRLLRASEKDLCVTCHRDVEGQFAKSYRHPVPEGIIRCSECHMTLSETRRELSLNGTRFCTKCHGELEGPFPHEHQATLDYSTEEGGCVSCHEAHGSHLPRMLRQPYEPPHFQLCTQCHAVPPGHNLNPRHGTQFAGVPCSDCHTDIHGSYDNRVFLSESLADQGCFTPSCHHR